MAWACASSKKDPALLPISPLCAALPGRAPFPTVAPLTSPPHLAPQVITVGGTLLACWQVADGTDPSELRQRLAQALPHSSKQVVLQRGLPG
jgi:hypothetical protein